MKFIIFSDLHYADEENKKSWLLNKKLYWLAEPLCKGLIDKMNNELKPDAVFYLGDMIEDLQDYDKDIKNYKYIWSVLQNFNMPFYPLVGNHDLLAMPSRKAIQDAVDYNEFTCSFDMNGVHFVLLSCEITEKVSARYDGGITNTNNLPQEDIEWFERDMQQNTLPCIVLTHYGLAEGNFDDNVWFYAHPNMAVLENRADVKRIIEKHDNILAVFTAHQHWTKHTKENGVNYYSIGSFTENVNNDGKPDGVYYEVDINDGDIIVREKHLV